MDGVKRGNLPLRLVVCVRPVGAVDERLQIASELRHFVSEEEKEEEEEGLSDLLA